MRKALFILSTLAALAAGAIFLRPQPPKALSSVYTFEARSSGGFQLGPKASTQDLRIETIASGEAELTRGSDPSALELRWNPAVKITVNGKRLDAQERVLSGAGPQRAVLLLSPEGLPRKIFLTPNHSLPPEAAEVLTNFTKMIFLQLAWNPQILAGSRTVDFWGAALLSRQGEAWATESEPRAQSGLRGHGLFRISFDARGLIDSLEGEQTTIPGALGAVGSSENRFRVKRISDSDGVAFSTEGLEESTPWVVINPQAILKAGYQEHTRGWSLGRVRAETEKLMKKGNPGMAELSPFSEKLQQMLWLDTSLAPTYSRLALELGPAHPLFDEIAKALSVVGDTRCQAALAELLRGSVSDRQAALKAMLAIGFLTNPGPEARGALEAVASGEASLEIKTSAELLLGQVAYQLRDSEPSTAAAIETRFRERLAQSTDPREKAHALDVIGNAGLCSDPSPILRIAADPAASTYTSAIEALRFCPRPEAATALVEAFLRGGDSARVAIASLEMRAQRGIRETAVRDALLRWYREKSTGSELRPRVFPLLESLSHGDERAAAEVEALKSR